MTTICYDGQTLASDRQACATFNCRAKKIWRLSDGSLFGAAGLFDQVLAVKDWLENGDPKPKGLTEFTGILVSAGGVPYRLETRLNRIRIFEKFHAVGSGAAFGVTAMALGKTAKEAVHIAARFDPRTGGGVDVLTR